MTNLKRNTHKPKMIKSVQGDNIMVQSSLRLAISSVSANFSVKFWLGRTCSSSSKCFIGLFSSIFQWGLVLWGPVISSLLHERKKRCTLCTDKCIWEQLTRCIDPKEHLPSLSVDSDTGCIVIFTPDFSN